MSSDNHSLTGLGKTAADETEQVDVEVQQDLWFDDNTRPYLLVLSDCRRLQQIREEGACPLQDLSFMQKWYDDGKPLFTKDMLRNFADQFDQYSLSPNSHEFTLISVDGKTYQQFILGKSEPVDHREFSDRTDVRGRLLARYKTFQELCWSESIGTWAYRYPRCSLTPSQEITPCYRATGEPCRKFDVPSEVEVNTLFDTIRSDWESSNTCQSLKNVLSPGTIPRKVTKIVAFACGSMTTKTFQDWDRSYYQHALILTLREILSSDPGDPELIKCYAQDPAYTPTDSHVLSKHNISILDDPRGFVEVDDHTLVISIAPNICVKQVIVDIAKPAVILWDEVDTDMAKMQEGLCTIKLTDPDSPRVIEMVRDRYEKREWLESMCEGWSEKFGNTRVYVSTTQAEV